jgi:hypothetical protein
MLVRVSCRLALLATAAALAACGATAGGSSSASGPVCGPTAATTLAASAQGRVYASGGSAYGCAAGGHGRIRLGGTRSCIGSSLVGPVTVRGALTAYALKTCGVDTGSTVVNVRRLTDGTQLRSAPAAGPLGPESYTAVSRLVLAKSGSVAWIVSTSSLAAHRRGIEVRRSDARGTALLDSGAAIAIHSLRLTGSTLHWRNGGQLRTASLH